MKLGHVALFARDPKLVADFYARFLGLEKVAEVVTEQTGEMVLMRTKPNGPPDLQLMSNPRGGHVAFQVETLAELRDLYALAPERGAQVVFSFDHGSTLSFYVHDPEGNTSEVFWATGRPPGIGNRPVDLAKSEDELMGLIGAS
ncbi:MAG: VOC family protein [Vicinamibacterales bacterium]